MTEKWPFEVGDQVEFTQDADPHLPVECYGLGYYVRAGTRGTVTDVRHDSVLVSHDDGTMRLHRGGDAPLLISEDGRPVIRAVSPCT